MPAHKLPRLSPTVMAILASGALLSGCDLWGGDDASSPNATVSDTAEPVVVAQMEEASSAAGGYLFSKTNVTGLVHEVDENGDTVDRVTLIGQQIHVIDPRTGLEIGSGPIVVDANSTQVVSQSFTMSADGLSQQANGINDTLFFTDGQRLYKVSLARSEATEMQQQVSSEEHICQLVKAIPKDANATGSWIVLTATRTASGDCAQADDVITKVVDSDATDSTAATNAGQIDLVLTAQRDGLGNLQGLLGLAPAETTSTTDDTGTVNKVTRRLVRMNGSGVVSNVDLGLDASLHAAYFGRVAGSTTKAYLRVTNDSNVNALYVLDWSTGTPSLSRTPAATLAFGDAAFVHTDTRATYFVDGVSLQSLNAGTGALTTLATLRKGAPQAGGVMTSSYLVVPQLDNDSGVLSLQAFSKTTANSVRDIAPPQTIGTLRVEAHNGDVLIVSNTFETTPGQPQTTLWRVDLNPAAIAYQRVSDQATLLSTTQAASETLTGEQQQAYVLWSSVPSGGALSVSSYQLSTSQTYVLTGSTPAWDLAQGTLGNITQGLLTTTTGDIDTLWSFDAGKAGSLIKVPANTNR